jgi:LacI family transcriptional regulator
MRTGKSMMIAIIIPDIKNPYFSVVLREIESILFKEGYTVAIFNTNEDAKHERAAIDACLVRNMDGIIICPTQRSYTNISFLKNSSVPYILMSRHFDDVTSTYVGNDDIKSGYLATRHLTDLGHKKIAFFSADQRISSAYERLEGYKEALREAGINYDQRNVISLSTTVGSDNILPMRTFFDKNPDCTAVVAFNDIIAFQTINFLNKIGKRVPEDVSVVGFDNISSDFVLPSPLTSVSVSKKEMATVSARLLIDALATNSPLAPQHVILSSQLLVRDSTAKAKI